jgi:transcriptional regulator with PAS, ATPase and Fis domain
MNLPAGLTNSWLATAGILESEFVRAESLFASENYKASLEVLNGGIHLGGADGSSTISGERLWALFAWNLFFLKKLDDVQFLWEKLGISDLFEFPHLQLVELWAQMHANRASEVVEVCDRFIENYRLEISPHIPDFLYLRGMANYQLGQTERAEEDLEVSYSFFKLLDATLGMGRSANYLGFVLLRKARYPEALKWLRRSLNTFEKLNLPKKQSMVLLNIGITYYKVGAFHRSIESLKRSCKIGQEFKLTHRQLFTNIALGNVYRILKDHARARRHLHTAYSQAQELKFPREEALALEFLGDVYRDERLFDEAMRFYDRAHAIGMAIAPRGDIVMEVHRRRGECHLARLDIRAAQSELATGLRMARAQEDRFEEAIFLRVMAEVWHHKNQFGEAARTINESIQILDEIGARHELGISLMRAAEFRVSEFEQGTPSLPVPALLSQAWDKATRALDNFLQVGVPWWIEEGQRLVKRISSLKDQVDGATDSRRVTAVGEDLAAYQASNVIIHKSRKMKDVLQLCDMFAHTEEPSLIVGETGTGKELLARRLHELSRRSGSNLVTVNVSAIPETLFEREFFGHVKGAFSGASADGPGYAGRAHGGTLFLDEIGDLPMEVQPKLLRLLQDGTYMAIGDPVERRADIRLIAATNADLASKVQRGEFRSDLYYRLRTLELELPPLRERPEDVLLLLRYFLAEAAGHPVDLSTFFNRDSLDLMERYEWPGNVREVAMVARRANVELKAKGRVELFLMRPNGGRYRVCSGPDSELPEPSSSNQLSSDAVERTRILLALEESGGCRTEAARQLEMSRSTLYRRMDRLGLND